MPVTLPNTDWFSKLTTILGSKLVIVVISDATHWNCVAIPPCEMPCLACSGPFLCHPVDTSEKAEAGRCCRLASCGITSSVHRSRREPRTCSTRTRAIARATSRISAPLHAATSAQKLSNTVMLTRCDNTSVWFCCCCFVYHYRISRFKY